MTESMHRIVLVAFRSDIGRLWAHEHWTTRHAVVFARVLRAPEASWSAANFDRPGARL